MSGRIRVVGDKEIMRKIKLLEDKNSDALKVAIQKASIHVEGVAKNTKAWKNVTGTLRSSITHEVTSRGKKHSGRIGTNVFYAPLLEFGTIKLPARPWLLPALIESKAKILQFLNDAIKKVK